MQPPRISVLNEQTINKIAAGEVIENPASVVKELVENSLDAGATTICVEIQEGGRQLIRVSDDGCGMKHDDALLCLERHATSKIREVEDIEDLMTMGFRGEAIPSIAAISKLTLLTSPQHGAGTLVQVEGGRIVACSAAPRSPGTTIEVKSLFFNVPVRRKFQKSPSYDTQEIVKMLGLLALAYPSIQFELVSDQKTLLKTTQPIQPLPFHELLKRQIESVLGKEYLAQLIPLKFQSDPYNLEGYISSPTSHKPNRTGQHLYLNQRCVYSPLIASALREGYGTMLPNHRYPFFVLHLRMPGSLLDVNVHPQKKEVRLRQEQQLKEILMKAVQAALQGKSKQEISFPFEETAPPFWSNKTSFGRMIPTIAEEKWEYRAPPLPPPPTPANEGLKTSSPPASLLPQSVLLPKVLATLLGYCILDPYQLEDRLFGTPVEKKGGLALLDQRAAYSRIHYEKLLKYPSIKEVQSLLLPITLHLTPAETRAIQEHLSLLNEMGFSLREFGENTFVIDAMPSFLKEEQLATCLQLLMQDLMEMQTATHLQKKKEERLALAACRASLPSLKRLSLEEAQGLVQQLLACEYPSQCPLGKPTCVYLSPEELAKWFK